MILTNADFWVGFCSSSLIISFFYTYFFFKGLQKKVNKISDSKSSFPEYEEYKRLISLLPRIKTGYSTVLGQLSEAQKPYPDSEMSQAVINGLTEAKERTELADLVSDRKETLTAIGIFSVIGLFYSIGAIILRKG